MERKSRHFPKKKGQAIEKAVHISGSTHLEIKQSFAKLWLREKQYKKYIYEVERCRDGSRVYLHRPTYKHGLDFAVSVEGFKSLLRKRKSKSTRPSHGDVFKDLRYKVKHCPKMKEDLFGAVTAIYECTEPQTAVRRFPRIKNISHGLPIDKILRIIKWLFIEQDVTYWLGTGRNMLMSEIERRVFKISDSKLFK
jgi:hypothetical protein